MSGSDTVTNQQQVLHYSHLSHEAAMTHSPSPNQLKRRGKRHKRDKFVWYCQWLSITRRTLSSILPSRREMSLLRNPPTCVLHKRDFESESESPYFFACRHEWWVGYSPPGHLWCCRPEHPAFSLSWPPPTPHVFLSVTQSKCQKISAQSDDVWYDRCSEYPNPCRHFDNRAKAGE